MESTDHRISSDGGFDDEITKSAYQPIYQNEMCKMHKKHRNRLSSSGHYFSTPLIDKSQIQVL